MIDVQLKEEPIEVQPCIDFVASDGTGGTSVFIGTVRSETRGRKVLYLDFEAYGPMAVREMDKIARRAIAEFNVHAVSIRHRTGRLQIGEIPVIIAVSAPHRQAAFEACAFAIDALKLSVPIWKKEVFEDGETWVAAHP